MQKLKDDKFFVLLPIGILIILWSVAFVRFVVISDDVMHLPAQVALFGLTLIFIPITVYYYTIYRKNRIGIQRQ